MMYSIMIYIHEATAESILPLTCSRVGDTLEGELFITLLSGLIIVCLSSTYTIIVLALLKILQDSGMLVWWLARAVVPQAWLSWGTKYTN